MAAAGDFTKALDTAEEILRYAQTPSWGKIYLSSVSIENPHPPFDDPVVHTGPVVALVGVSLA